MELNDFQYNWYLHFEEENEKSYFGLSFDPLLEAKNYSPETICEYVIQARKALKRSKPPTSAEDELHWLLFTTYVVTYFYIQVSFAFYEESPSFCPRADISTCSSTSAASIMMHIIRGCVFFIPVTLFFGVPLIEWLKDRISSSESIMKKLRAYL
jgi:hypothetical protein